MGDVWIFGYGSLIWKVDFPVVERRPCYTFKIKGWVRRFWQGSTDHRGTAEFPGRVVTLIPIDEYKEKYQKLDETPLAGHKEEDEACFGIAYRIASGDADNVLAHLDHREKDGFITFCMPVYSCKTDERFADATVYVGTSQNTSFKGPAPFQEMAVQIAKSRGDSGWNRDYLFGLETALSVLGYQGDLHVGELAKRVREIGSVGVDEELTDEIVGSRCINSEDIAELEKLRADVH